MSSLVAKSSFPIYDRRESCPPNAGKVDDVDVSAESSHDSFYPELGVMDYDFQVG